MPYLYSNFPSQHLPNLPLSDRCLTGDSKVVLGEGRFKPESRVPYQQIVNIIATLEGLIILKQQVLKCPENRPDCKWPILVETATQQDDIESKNSMYRKNCGDQAMGRVNNTTAETARNAAETLMTDSDARVTLALDGVGQGYLSSRNKKMTSYTSMEDDPTQLYNEPAKWNRKIRGSAPDTAKQTSLVKSAARKKAESDSSAPAAPSIRGYHSVNLRLPKFKVRKHDFANQAGQANNDDDSDCTEDEGMAKSSTVTSEKGILDSDATITAIIENEENMRVAARSTKFEHIRVPSLKAFLISVGKEKKAISEKGKV